MLCTTVHKVISTYIVCLPVQLRPFPASTYPEPQEQVKLPWLLVQVWSQPPLLVAHSLMSVEKGCVVSYWQIKLIHSAMKAVDPTSPLLLYIY